MADLPFPGPYHMDARDFIEMNVDLQTRWSMLIKKCFHHPTSNPLRSTVYFPSFNKIDSDYETDVIDLVYYRKTSNDNYFPRIVWCFIGEITDDANACNPSFLIRNRIWVKDRVGRGDINVSFYPNQGYLNYYDLKVGYTIVIQTASKHIFRDGSTGFRIENLDRIRVIKLSLLEVYDAAELYFKHRDRTCWTCSKSKEDCEEKCLKKCSQCRVGVYCEKSCQKKDWKDGKHKLRCKEMRKIANLVDFNYEYDFEKEATVDGFPRHIMDVRLTSTDVVAALD